MAAKKPMPKKMVGKMKPVAKKDGDADDAKLPPWLRRGKKMPAKRGAAGAAMKTNARKKAIGNLRRASSRGTR